MITDKVYIYGLADPRDRKIHYVGHTIDLDQRTGQHLTDPAWDYMKRIDWAIREYRDYMDDSRPDEEIANTIRAACRRKAVRGTSQDGKGAWYFRPPAFRGWLVKARTESRGRPIAQS